jgi:hypothetical protein
MRYLRAPRAPRALRVCLAASPRVTPRLLVAGFPLPIIPEIRRALDDAGEDAYNIDIVVTTEGMLDRDLLLVMQSTPPIDWLSPMPAEWSELNVAPTLLFTNLHPVSQADITEVVRSVSNGWPVKFGDCERYDGLTVGEAIARVATSKTVTENDGELVIDYIDEDDEEAVSDEESDGYMVSAGDIDATDFSENLFLSIDEIVDRRSTVEDV